MPGLKTGSFIYNMHISPYEGGNRFNHEPLRTRKLSCTAARSKVDRHTCMKRAIRLCRASISKMAGSVELAWLKEKYDKRHAIGKGCQREVERGFKERQLEIIPKMTIEEKFMVKWLRRGQKRQEAGSGPWPVKTWNSYNCQR